MCDRCTHNNDCINNHSTRYNYYNGESDNYIDTDNYNSGYNTARDNDHKDHHCESYNNDHRDDHRANHDYNTRRNNNSAYNYNSGGGDASLLLLPLLLQRDVITDVTMHRVWSRVSGCRGSVRCYSAAIADTDVFYTIIGAQL